MAKVSCIFLIVALLFCSGIQIGMCQHTDQRSQVLSQYGNEAMINKVGIFCRTCKSVVRKLLAIVGKHISKDAAGRKLDKVCAKLKIGVGQCIRFVRKYRAKLINALSTGANGHKICFNLLKVC